MKLLQNNHEAYLLELFAFRIAFSLMCIAFWVCAYLRIENFDYVLLLLTPFIFFQIECHPSRRRIGASEIALRLILYRILVMILITLIFAIVFYFMELRHQMRWFALITSGSVFIWFVIQRLFYKEKVYVDSYGKLSKKDQESSIAEQGIPEKMKSKELVSANS